MKEKLGCKRLHGFELASVRCEPSFGLLMVFLVLENSGLGANAATVQASYTSATGSFLQTALPISESVGHGVRCDYTVSALERFQRIELYFEPNDSPNHTPVTDTTYLLVQMYFNGDSGWGDSTSTDIRSRAQYSASVTYKYLALDYRKTRPGDDKLYVCKLTYQVVATGTNIAMTSTANVTLNYDTIRPTIAFNPPPPLILSTSQAQAGDGPFSITCEQPQGFHTNATFSIKNATETLRNAFTLVRATSDDQQAKVVDGITGITASGSFSSSIITATILKAACEHAGRFMCESSFITSQKIISNYKIQNYSIEVGPGQLSMNAAYSGDSDDKGFRIQDTLQLDCSGPVGTVTPNTQLSWIWRYKDRQEQDFQVYNDSTAITDVPELTIKPHHCYENQTSRLTRRLNVHDIGRQYQCFVSRGVKQYLDFAASYTLGTLYSTQVVTISGCENLAQGKATEVSFTVDTSFEQNCFSPLTTVRVVVTALNDTTNTTVCEIPVGNPSDCDPQQNHGQCRCHQTDGTVWKFSMNYTLPESYVGATVDVVPVCEPKELVQTRQICKKVGTDEMEAPVENEMKKDEAKEKKTDSDDNSPPKSGLSVLEFVGFSAGGAIVGGTIFLCGTFFFFRRRSVPARGNAMPMQVHSAHPAHSPAHSQPHGSPPQLGSQGRPTEMFQEESQSSVAETSTSYGDEDSSAYGSSTVDDR